MGEAKARPILFNGQMVRALLDGRKTQTRRVVKPQPKPVDNLASEAGDVFIDYDGSLRRFRRDRRQNFGDDIIGEAMPCPYGSAGDLLYVRETYTVEHSLGLDYSPPYNDGRPTLREWNQDEGSYWMQPHYRATDDPPTLCHDDGFEGCRWTPSIHMCRWASRLTLRITDVRVERVQDISDDDADAEGIDRFNQPTRGDDYQGWYRDYLASDGDDWPWIADDGVESFRSLWASINGPDAWEVNPWVWAVSFEVIRRNVDDVIATTDTQGGQADG